MHERIEFSPHKIVEAILYVAEKLDSPTLFFVSKSLYHADLRHLQNYGLPIAGDSYAAMKHGPVPSGAYDMMKHVRGNVLSRLASAVKGAFIVENDKYIKPKRSANIDILSESDTEALDYGISRVNGKSFAQVSNESHDSAWESVDENDIISLEAITNMLENGKLINDYLSSPVPD